MNKVWLLVVWRCIGKHILQECECQHKLGIVAGLINLVSVTSRPRQDDLVYSILRLSIVHVPPLLGCCACTCTADYLSIQCIRSGLCMTCPILDRHPSSEEVQTFYFSFSHSGFFRRITKPSRVLLRLIYSSSSSSARSPCPSTTGVL